MKFSLRYLLAVIAAASLFANAWQVRSKDLSIQREIDFLELKSQERHAMHSLSRFEERRGIHEHVKESHAILKAQYATAEIRFQDLIEKYGQLKIENTNEFAITSIPTFNTRDITHRSWRVYVPENSSMNLNFNFTDRLVGLNNKLFEPKSFFEPTTPTSITLPVGESEIRFTWTPTANGYQATLIVNGESMCEYLYTGYFSGYADISVETKQQVSMTSINQHRLLEFTPVSSSHRETIQLSITPTKPTGETQ